MPYVSVNGVDHYYEWISQDPNPGVGSRPVMVFVHGWAGSARYWESTARAIAADYDCLLYDMRGFGRSQAATMEAMAAQPELSSLESFADDLLTLLNTLGLKQPLYLNAHSLGGTVGLYFLDRYPERVRKAILTCNGSFPYQKWAFEAFYLFGGYVVALRPQWLAGIPGVPHLFMSRFLKRSIPLFEKQAFLEDFLKADGPTAMGTLKAAVSKHATEVMPAAFAALKVPTLMVSGKYDKITPAPLGRQAAELSEQMQYALMPDTGHFPMLENPERYLEIIGAFLRAEMPVEV